jgi:hypothetical protein
VIGEVTNVTFAVRLAGDGRVDADLILEVRWPDGVRRTWRSDFAYQGLGSATAESPVGMREFFGQLARDIYDDYRADFRHDGMELDRRFEDLDLVFEIPDVAAAALGLRPHA